MRKVLLFILGSILSMSLFAQEALIQANFGIQKDSVIGYVKSWRGPEFVESSKEYWTWQDWQKAESQVHLVWDHATEAWKPNKNIHFSYHGGHGKKTASFFHTWDKATHRWWKTQRDTTIYHSSGKEREVYTHKLTMGSSFWRNRKKEVYTYQTDRVYNQDSYNWDISSESWQEYSRLEIGENEAGQIEYYRSYVWDSQNSNWFFVGRASYRYDDEGRLMEETLFDEDDLKMRRYLSTYNKGGLLKEIIEYQGYPRGVEWTESKRYTYLYSPEGKFFREDQEYWESNTQSWVLNNYFLIYGKNHREALQAEIESPSLSCTFPNPYRIGTPFICSEMLSGKSYTMEVIDLSGRLIDRKEVLGDEIFSLKQEVVQGLYFLLIKDESTVLAKEKIFIQKP